jgi:hypothetical protein
MARGIRIVSKDPLGHDTKFYDTETGAEIRGVYKYVLTCAVDRAPSLKLYVRGGEVDVVASAEITHADSE